MSIHDSLLWFPNSFSNKSGRLQQAIRRGWTIPEGLLPGRMLMAMTPQHRAELAKADLMNVSPWWIKIVCG
jgi:hypothetical protein